MSREPNLDSFFDTIADVNFALDKLVEDVDDVETIAELMWYMDASRAEQVQRELSNRYDDDEETRERIIRNLAGLYPLSRELLIEILREIRESDYPFIKGFDVSQEICTELRKTLTELEKASGGTTGAFHKYKQQIDNLEKRAREMRAASEQFRDLQTRRNQLEDEVRRLEGELDRKKLEQNIDTLQDEARKLNAQLADHEDNYARINKRIDNIKHELAEQQSRMSGDEQRLLRELLIDTPHA